MTVKDIMDRLFLWTPSDRECKGDKLVFGDEAKEVKKVAVCCIATCDVMRRAAEWGADFILTHEPTFHDHFSDFEKDELYLKKMELAEKLGMAIFRFHDHSHFTDSDKIIEGVLDKLGWKGSFDGVKKFTFDEEKDVAEIIKDGREKLNLCHIRPVGAVNKKVKTVSMCVGSWGADIVLSEVKKNDIDLVICGEVTEWSVAEYVRDAAQIGMNKTLLYFGHMGSERSGMEYVCEWLKKEIPTVEFKNFDCGEVYL